MITLGTCPFCAEERWIDLLEFWPEERAWLTDTCCEESQEDLQDQLEYGLSLRPAERARFFAPIRALFEGYGEAFRSIVSDGAGAARYEAGLQTRPAVWADARDFVAEHHRHNRKPRGWKWGHEIRNGTTVVGYAIVGRPVARMIATRDPGALEVTRCCVRTDLDAGLVWNACTMLYAEAAREAKRRGYTRLITYTREDEDGTTLKAAGWSPVATTAARSWHTEARPRPDSDAPCRKIRWERQLRRAKRAA